MPNNKKVRQKRYYDNKLRNKGTCEKCYGPCNARSKLCKECVNELHGIRLAKITRERVADGEVPWKPKQKTPA